MAKKPRFYGWEFGDSARDQVVLEVYERYQADKMNFADYCKELVFKVETGQLVQASGNNAAVLQKLEELKRMLLNGSLRYDGTENNPGTDDEELLGLLGNVGT